MKSYYIKTFGCQMNEHDSKKIRLLLEARGLQPAASAGDADLILFNTCTIRDKAQHKALSEIGRTARIKRARPEVVVGVCGCVAQQQKEALFDRFPHIDLLFGPDMISSLPTLLDGLQKERCHVAALDLVNTPEEYNFLNLVPWVHGSGGSAFVTIMKGCDSRCSYCIVPKVRGDEVSRPADDIIAEVCALAERGVKEVTLLGQTVNSYGKNGQSGTVPFPVLLQRIADETPIERIRFTSPHPKDANLALADAFRNNSKLCRHIHLPVQAGSDRILRLMRRAYSKKQYMTKVEMLKRAAPDIAISTDIIVGFPGETELDFAETMGLVRDVCFDGIFAFKYSPRPGTESFARMADDVTQPVKEERLAVLLDLHARQARRKHETMVGSVFDVLVEGQSVKEEGQLTGRTTHNRIVNFTGDPSFAGSIQCIKITRTFANSLGGEIVKSEIVDVAV